MTINLGKKYDVIVVGAGSAGCFASYKLTKAGLSVALIEYKGESSIGKKVCGDAIGAHHFKTLNLEEPKIGVDAMGIFDGIKVYSPSEKEYITVLGKGFALNRHAFGQRLLRMALNAGAELFDKHKAIEPIIEGSWVKGVKVLDLKNNSIKEFYGKIVIDATGAISAIRRKLPKEWWISEEVPNEDYNVTYREVWEVDMDLDTKYAEIYLNPEIAPGGYWWFFPKSKNIVNIGLGVQGKPDNPNPLRQFMKYLRIRFKDRIVRVIDSGGGIVPTRRTLSCMVWNGFLVIGDAACTANPLHGGGIGPSMLSALKASETIVEALDKGEPTISNLWGYHRKYHRIYGAKQAALDLVRMYLQGLSGEELNFFIERKVVSGLEVLDMGYEGELKLSILKKLGIAVKLMNKPYLLKEVKALKDYMDKIRSLYLNFPETLEEYSRWLSKVNELINEFKLRIMR